MVYWTELEQEPYDPEEFVERLAWRTASGPPGGVSGSPRVPRGSPATSAAASDGNALQLHDAFVQAIKDLTAMHEAQKSKCEKLEQACRDEEQAHWKRVAALIERNRAAAFTYKSLDEKINSVATKVVHLGDQLESVNTPRSRDDEALRLMRHLDEFLAGEHAPLSPVFTDKARLHEAADIIQKLQLIAQELPPKQFDAAISAIEKKYSEVERALIEEFVRAHRSDDLARMKDIAEILSHFKGYNQCIDAFIEQIQVGQHGPSSSSSTAAGVNAAGMAGMRANKDAAAAFRDVVPLCEASWKTIERVFPNPQQVMAKFVLNVYHHRLKEHIAVRLADKNNAEAYLDNLYSLYSQTVKLTGELSHFNLGSDQLYLSNLTKTIFRGYLDSYINVECRYLNDKCASVLQRYYADKGHQKKASASAAGTVVQDLKRATIASIASKANIMGGHISDHVASAAASATGMAGLGGSGGVNYGGETFLSEEAAINILQLTKNAFRRCQALSRPQDLPSNAAEILGILVSYLVREHVDYAVEIGLQGIPMADCKTIPELYFFDVLAQTNAIIHLFEKQFGDSVLPLVAATPKHSDCLQKKKNELERIEHKLDAGLDRTLNSIVGWVKTILQQEQKKTDFNPAGSASGAPLATASSACVRVVKFVNYHYTKISDSMDGKNIEAVLSELGVRLHRAVYDHLQGFQYSSSGVVSVMFDVQEYRKCVSQFRVASVNALFDTLYAMCNLLMMPAENLRGAMQGDQLAALDRTILDNWIQLRTDYRAERLGQYI